MISSAFWITIATEEASDSWNGSVAIEADVDAQDWRRLQSSDNVVAVSNDELVDASVEEQFHVSVTVSGTWVKLSPQLRYDIFFFCIGCLVHERLNEKNREREQVGDRKRLPLL